MKLSLSMDHTINMLCKEINRRYRLYSTCIFSEHDLLKVSLTAQGSLRSEECCPAEAHSLAHGMLVGLSGHAQYPRAGQDDNPVYLSSVIQGQKYVQARWQSILAGLHRILTQQKTVK